MTYRTGLKIPDFLQTCNFCKEGCTVLSFSKTSRKHFSVLSHIQVDATQLVKAGCPIILNHKAQGYEMNLLYGNMDTSACLWVPECSLTRMKRITMNFQATCFHDHTLTLAKQYFASLRDILSFFSPRLSMLRGKKNIFQVCPYRPKGIQMPQQQSSVSSPDSLPAQWYGTVIKVVRKLE